MNAWACRTVVRKEKPVENPCLKPTIDRNVISTQAMRDTHGWEIS